MLHKQLAHHWNQAKSFIGGHYRRLGKMAGDFDKLAGIGRRAFATLAPVLEDFGQGEVVKQGVKAIGAYDRMRKNVFDADSYARMRGGQIADAQIFE